MVNQDKHIIIKSLDIDEYVYSELVMAAGMEYLRTKICSAGDECSVNVVSKSDLFWKWWVNNWNMRDIRFIDMCNLYEINETLSGDFLKAARELYVDVHSVKEMVIVPNKFAKKQMWDLINGELFRWEHELLKVLK